MVRKAGCTVLTKRAIYLFTFVTLASLLLATTSLSLVSRAAGAPEEDSKEVSDLLSQARAQAVELKNDATEMESFTRSNVSWESHAAKITAIQNHVNTVGETVAKLNQASTAASPWQKTAIDRVTPLLQELARNTTSIINHLNNEKGRRLNTQEHKEYLKTNAELAANMSSVIADSVDYGKTKAKFEKEARQLEASDR
jgi:hypothetical protein